jgi:pimeloyl-ACP methyl ester carboxylesterase
VNDAISEFRIDVPQEQLDDLVERIRRTRWAERETVDDWSQGVPLSYLREIVAYWANEYDWRAREARLNRFPQFMTTIDGLGIHFLHVRSPEPDATPLIMTHGWPGSIVEFDKVIDPLTDPVAHGGDAADAFHLVCPSLPGYAFSEKPTEPGWSVDHTADAWAQLMARLGYDRYFAQGGDWGSMVTSAIAMRDLDHCMGVHLNMPVVIPDMEAEMTPEEQAALERQAEFFEWETGYSKQQSTRPQTLGYALVDSPVGQAAWILEKFKAWTDTKELAEERLTRDELLDNVMLYWIPGTGASSARLYWESYNTLDMSPIGLPMGCSIFPGEIFHPSRRWAETRFKDLRYWGEPTTGGHFAAFEAPEVFVDEVRACFRTLRG